MADLSVGLLTFENGAVPPANQPKLSCTAANQLALEGSSLRLERGRELFFRDNGQVRCFDDHHRVVFNRSALSLELHEQGDICFLTGGPPPEERLRILANGNVGIGTTAPVAKLQVTGGAIMPAVGNTAQAGLQFPTNPGGGLGDEAFIRYFASVGETTKLLIGIGNDADDTIGFQQMGDRKSTRLNSSHVVTSRMPSSA